jgi:hypothetical protein
MKSRILVAAAVGILLSLTILAIHVTDTAQIINTSTGEVTSHVIMANTEGDFH